jgi:hypothetical protein
MQRRNRRHRLQRQKEDRAKRRHARSSFPEEVAQWPPRHVREYDIDPRSIAIFFFAHPLILLSASYHAFTPSSPQACGGEGRGALPFS